jgi:hypothetical protein
MYAFRTCSLQKRRGKKKTNGTTVDDSMADEKEEEPKEVWPKKGSFVFSNGGRYGWCPHTFPFRVP